MRNWNNRVYGADFIPRIGFIDYLWGIETSMTPMTWQQLTLFIDYLWGIETTNTGEATIIAGKGL